MSRLGAEDRESESCKDGGIEECDESRPEL